LYGRFEPEGGQGGWLFHHPILPPLDVN
jgi:hypothetical protein